jgi:hypothetical protein
VSRGKGGYAAYQLTTPSTTPAAIDADCGDKPVSLRPRPPALGCRMGDTDDDTQLCAQRTRHYRRPISPSASKKPERPRSRALTRCTRRFSIEAGRCRQLRTGPAEGQALSLVRIAHLVSRLPRGGASNLPYVPENQMQVPTASSKLIGSLVKFEGLRGAPFIASVTLPAKFLSRDSL